jgi:TonB-dependent receptor
MRDIKILVLVFSTLFAGLASAQTNGKIAGKVSDKKTGEELIGVSVIIEGTTIAVATDIEGKYILSVKPGTYNVVFSYVSYQKKVVTGVVVKEGQTTLLNSLLDDAAQDLKEVVIQAEARRETSAALLLDQKRSTSISDGVSADLIRKSGDATTSDVMKRVSGTSIQDNKFAIIRGLNDRYNTAYINGAPLPSSESDRKAFSFDIFPSNMLDNMVITKTASPDLPGDFAGGLITINTKDIPEKKFVAVSLGASMHSITTGKKGYTYEGGKTDWLGYDDGTRAVPSGLPARLEYEKADAATKYNSSLKFNDNWKTQTVGSIPMNNSIQLSGGNNYKVGKNDQAGFIISGSWNRSFRNTTVERNRFNKPMGQEENQFVTNYTDQTYKEEALVGIMANVGYKIGSNHKFSFKNAYTMNGEDQTIMRTGNDNFLDADYLPKVANTYYNYQQSKLMTNQLIGQHFIPSAKVKMKWVLNTNNIKRDVPDFRRFSTRSTLLDASTGEYTPYAAQIGPNIDITQTGRFYSSLEEKIKSASFEVQRPVEFLSGKKVKTEAKIGGFTQTRERDFSARVFGYKLRFVNSPGSPYNYQQFIQTPMADIFGKDYLAQDTLYIDERINPQDTYKASSRLNSAFAMFDQRLFSRFRAVYGVRMERYNQKLNTLGQAGEPVTVDTTFTDFLPSMNFTYELNEKTNLRLSGSKTLARPEFRELAPFAFYDFNLNTVVAGRPTLSRTTIQNYDFRYEYFPGEGQLISASLFYKKFDNAIEMVYEYLGSDATLGYTSDAKAKNYGFEVELRKNFDFVDKLAGTTWAKKFTFTTNYARIFSEVQLDKAVAGKYGTRPLQGQSPYILNSSIQFYDPKSEFSVALFVNRIGRRIYIAREKNGLVPDMWENPRTVVDLNITKKFYKKFEAKLAISDIFAQDLVFYQDNNDNKKFDDTPKTSYTDPNITQAQKGKLDNVINRYKMGYTVSFGISYKL